VQLKKPLSTAEEVSKRNNKRKQNKAQGVGGQETLRSVPLLSEKKQEPRFQKD
jgi:hypothetical protein